MTVHLPYGFSSIKLQAVTAAGAQFGPPGFETDLLYLACLAALVLGGSGPLAIDGLRAKRRQVARPLSHAGAGCRGAGGGRNAKRPKAMPEAPMPLSAGSSQPSRSGRTGAQTYTEY